MKLMNWFFSHFFTTDESQLNKNGFGTVSYRETPDPEYVYVVKDSEQGGYYVDHDAGGAVWSKTLCNHVHKYLHRQAAINDMRGCEVIRVRKDSFLETCK